MTKNEALKMALEFVASISPAFICEATHHKKNEEHASNEPCPHVKKQKQTYEAIKEALAQPEQYTTDAMKVRQAVAQALHDDVYAEELEQPEAKQSGTISITMPAPVAYLCENAVGHKYFRWKKPSSTYKPIPLYTTPPQRTWVGLTDEEISALAWNFKVDSQVIRLVELEVMERNL